MPPRLPLVIQQGAIGTTNPASATGLGTGPGISQQLGRGPRLSREHFGNRQQNATQAKAERAYRQAAAADDAASVVLRGVSLTANTAKALTHYLGQAWTSYRIENVVGAFARFQAIHTSDDVHTITVESDATCTCDVRVWV